MYVCIENKNVCMYRHGTPLNLLTQNTDQNLMRDLAREAVSRYFVGSSEKEVGQ